MLILFGFIYGAFIASFLQCFCFHWINGTLHSFYLSRSTCDSCHGTLTWYHLIPVLSYLLGKGRCHFCQRPIGSFYFIHELIAGLFYSFFFYIIYESPMFILHLILITLLHIFFLTDLMAFWLPDVIQFFVLLISYWIGYSPFNHWSVYFFISTILFIFYYINPNWIGGGDLKLILILTLLIGTDLFPYFLLLSACIGLIWFTLSKQTKIPFGPSIIISFIILYYILL